MTAIQPSLTLYAIETELMELLTFRESLLEDSDVTPAEQQESLKAIDQRIYEYVAAEVKKVDNVAHYLREFEARAAVYANEIERLKRLMAVQEDRRKRLSDMVLSIMIQTNQPKLEGRLSTFKLAKNPPSAEIAQPGLVPDNYQKLTGTMSPDTWNSVKKSVLRNEALAKLAAVLMECKVSEPEPMKAKILEELKQTDSCDNCQARGVFPVPDGEPIKCSVCKGTGKLNRAVAGCRLITDRKRLAVS